MGENWFPSLSISISLMNDRSYVLEKRKEKKKVFLFLCFVCRRKSVSSSLFLEFDHASTWLEVEITSLVVSLPWLCVDHHWKSTRLEALWSTVDLLR